MKRLKALDVDEISLVDIGANKKKFLVFKSKSGSNKMSLKNVIKSLRVKKAAPDMEEEEKKKEAAKKAKEDEEKEAAKKAAEGDMLPGKDSAVHKVSEGAEAALKAIARILTPFKDELKGEHIEQALKEVGIGKAPAAAAEEGAPNKDEELKKLFAIPEDVKEEHAAEALSKAQEAMGSHLEKLGYRKYGDEQISEKAKEEDEVHKAKYEKIQKAHTDLIKKNADLEAKIKDIEKKECEKEIVQKAASFTKLGLKQEDVVEVLRAAKEMSPKHYETVCKHYTALNEQAKCGSLFAELGSGLANTGASEAEAKIDAAVNEIVKKSGKSQAECYTDFIQSDEGKKLYAEMKQNRPNGI
jgi:hypothetical protein